LGKIDLLTGTGLPERRDENPEENVAAKHEGEADCFGNSDSVDPHHNPLCLPWVQLREMSSCFCIKTCNYYIIHIYIYIS
jgi:hypothetical protein